MLLSATLGQSRVFTRTGERTLWLLGANEAVLWDLYTEGIRKDVLADLLAERFGIAPSLALRQLDDHLLHWRQTGLLRDHLSLFQPKGLTDFEELPQFPPPVVTGRSPFGWPLGMAGQTVFLSVLDTVLRGALGTLLAHMHTDGNVTPPHHANDQVELAGDASGWQINVNGATMIVGQGQDEAVVETLGTLSRLCCHKIEQLFFLHGAGLVSPKGHGLLLAAPGGAGKTTLAMALEAKGFRLLSDDVVPIERNGDALALGLAACIKPGSWQVLRDHRPDLADAPEVFRFGQSVRYLPPRHPVIQNPVKPCLLIFPQYTPHSPTLCQQLDPESVLQKLVASDSVIRDLTQSKLEALCQWIGTRLAFELTYPNLESAVMQISQLLKGLD